MKKILFLAICLFLATSGLAFAQSVQNSVDIIWQTSSSYTPYWYNGKALYKSGDTLELIAMAQSGSEVLNPDNIIFTWEKNGTVLGSLSGLGKNKLVLPTSFIDQTLRINVSARSQSGDFSASGRTIIEESPEQVHVYETDPLFGVLNNIAIQKDYLLDKPEVSFLAVPFFFSAGTASGPALDWSWLLDNREIESSNNEVIFKRTGEAGSASIEVSVDHINKMMEAAESKFRILFGE